MALDRKHGYVTLDLTLHELHTLNGFWERMRAEESTSTPDEEDVFNILCDVEMNAEIIGTHLHRIDPDNPSPVHDFRPIYGPVRPSDIPVRLADYLGR